MASRLPTVLRDDLLKSKNKFLSQSIESVVNHSSLPLPAPVAPVASSSVTERQSIHKHLMMATALLPLTLAACGGGGDADSAADDAAASNTGVDGESVAEVSNNMKSGINPDAFKLALPTAPQAARFLQQAQFASVDSDLANVQRLGYASWLAQQFAAPVPLTSWDWLISKGYNTAATIDNSGPDRALWQQLIASPNAMRQRFAFALSEFFVVSINGIGENPFFSAGYWDLLVAQCLGNFRTLLEAVTLSPAMGRYLSTAYNEKGNASTGQQPDQNYAREVMQLFTIGLYELNADGSLRLNASGQPIETYDQQTVASLSKVFTGWEPDMRGDTQYATPLRFRNPMILVPSRHDLSTTSFLGTTIAAGTDGKAALKQALDTLFNHPNVGPFFGRQMIQRLVMSNPSSAYVGRITAVFNNNGKGVRGDLKAVFAAVLLDAEARSDSLILQPFAGKLREPVQRFVQWARSFGAVSPNDVWQVFNLSASATGLGQSPLRAGSVFNFFRPGYVPPNTSLAQQHLVAPEFQIADEVTVTGYVNFMQSAIDGGKGLIAPYTVELTLAKNASALLDRLSLVLCGGQLSSQTKNMIRTALEALTISNAADALKRVKAAVLLVMVSADYLIQF